jgi:hypothetical protein
MYYELICDLGLDNVTLEKAGVNSITRQHLGRAGITTVSDFLTRLMKEGEDTILEINDFGPNGLDHVLECIGDCVGGKEPQILLEYDNDGVWEKTWTGSITRFLEQNEYIGFWHLNTGAGGNYRALLIPSGNYTFNDHLANLLRITPDTEFILNVTTPTSATATRVRLQSVEGNTATFIDLNMVLHRIHTENIVDFRHPETGMSLYVIEVEVDPENMLDRAERYNQIVPDASWYITGSVGDYPVTLGMVAQFNLVDDGFVCFRYGPNMIEADVNMIKDIRFINDYDLEAFPHAEECQIILELK